MEAPLTPSAPEPEEEISEGEFEKMFVQERAEFRRLLSEGRLSKRTAHSVLASGKLPGIIAAAIIKLAKTRTGLFLGLVDYDRNREELVRACRFDFKYIDFPLENWPVTRRGKHQVEIREEHLAEYQTVIQIDARRSAEEEDADPIAVLEIFGRQNPDRQREHELLTFFTACGQPWYLVLNGDIIGRRSVECHHLNPRKEFDPYCRVLRVLKSV